MIVFVVAAVVEVNFDTVDFVYYLIATEYLVSRNLSENLKNF